MGILLIPAAILGLFAADKWSHSDLDDHRESMDKAFAASEADIKKAEKTLSELGVSPSALNSLALEPAGNLSIGSASLQHSLQDRTANKDGIFVIIRIGITNPAKHDLYVNPINFTLADPRGYTAPPETLSYSLSGCLQPVTLSPGQQTSGSLAFYMPRAAEYVLTHRSMDGGVVTIKVKP